MRNLFVIVLALWSGVAMAQTKTGSGLNPATYQADQKQQVSRDSMQAVQIAQKTDKAQVANNAALLSTATPVALTVYEVLLDANTGTRGYYFINTLGEIYWIAAAKIK